MNTKSLSPRMRGLLAAAAFSAIAPGFTALCQAADITDAPTAIVEFGDLNIATAQGAAALYGRIDAAAQAVCRPFDGRQVMLLALKAACLRHAIADAVSAVGAPGLYAVYNARHSTPLPARLASNRR